MPKALIIVDTAPYGTATCAEAFRTITGLAGMDIETATVLVGDGVFVAKKGQNPSVIGMKSLEEAYSMLSDFGVKLYIVKESLEERNFNEEDLIPVDKIITMDEFRKLIEESQCVITFHAGG